MPEVKFDLEAVCECGAELSIKQGTWPGQITVEACETCLNQKYEEGQSDLQKEFDRG